MKILLISNTNNIKNGGGNMTHELCSFLATRCDITLLLPKDAPKYDYATYKIEYVLPTYIFDVKTPTILDYIMFEYSQTKGFDIVHSLFEFPYAFIGARLAEKYDKPFIIGTQGTYAIKPLFEFPQKYILKWIYNNADRIVSASQFTKDAIIEHSGTKTPIDIIHNGVNFARFSRQKNIEDIRTKYPGKQLLLTVGGFKPRKGQDIVLRALGKVIAKRSDFHYLIVGPHENRNEYIESLHAIIADKGLMDNVTFVGECSDDDIVRYFQACDIYVHTTRVVNWNFEGYGIVYLEAGACGKPSIAAHAGGAPDAVVDGETGIIVPEEDVSATALAIEKMLKSPELARELGQGGRVFAENHDWSIIGMKYFDLYKKLL